MSKPPFNISAVQTTVYGAPAVRITGLSGYSLSMTFDCGQCFRFEASDVIEGAFEGVAYGRFLRVMQDTDDDMTILGCTMEEYENIWRRFFSLDKDWHAIKADIESRSPELFSAAQTAGGIRILTQDRFEALCSFIISQCNNIPRIKGLVRALCQKYGEPILTPEGDTVYTFPTPESILSRPVSELSALKLGYRDKYIYAAAKAASEGLLDRISSAETTAEAHKLITSVEGVGKKVAACALLFGFERYDAFPVDVWMKRALERLFGGVGDYSVFGPYAGVAQQYLFFCERYVHGNQA